MCSALECSSSWFALKLTPPSRLCYTDRNASCRVYIHLLYLRISARRIRLQQTIAVIRTLSVGENRHITRPFKLARVVCETQDCSSRLSSADWVDTSPEANQSDNHPNNHTFNQTSIQPTNQLVNKRINQPSNHQMDHPPNQPINPPTKLINTSTHPPTNPSTNPSS